jgi:hypothetical protein
MTTLVLYKGRTPKKGHYTEVDFINLMEYLTGKDILHNEIGQDAYTGEWNRHRSETRELI